TNFGLFQTAGENFAAAGFADVFAMAGSVAQSEANQLAAFEQFIRSKDLMDELRNHDWAGFAAAYHPSTDTARYASALTTAFNAEKAKGGVAPGGAAPDSGFIGSLVAKNAAKLTDADVAASAARMKCEPACVRTVL